MRNSVKHSLIILSKRLLSSLLTSFEKKEETLYRWVNPDLDGKDLDPTNKLSDDEWEEFVKTQKDGFSEEGSKLGIQFLRHWISDGHLERFREMKKKEREVKSLRKLLDDN